MPDLIYSLLIIVIISLITGLLAFQKGVRSGEKSQSLKIGSLTERCKTQNAMIEQLQADIANLQKAIDESGEWIEVPVILFGLSWGENPHTLIQMNTRTGRIRPSQRTRLVLKRESVFHDMSLPMLGAPKWSHLRDDEQRILLLEGIYTLSEQVVG